MVPMSMGLLSNERSGVLLVARADNWSEYSVVEEDECEQIESVFVLRMSGKPEIRPEIIVGKTRQKRWPSPRNAVDLKRCYRTRNLIQMSLYDE